MVSELAWMQSVDGERQEGYAGTATAAACAEAAIVEEGIQQRERRIGTACRAER